VFQASRNQGNAILVCLGVMTVLAILVSVAASVTSHQARMAERDRVRQAAIEVADGALEMLFFGWRKISSTTTAPITSPLTSSAFDTEIPMPTAQDFPHTSRFTASRQPNTAFILSNYQVQAVTPLLEPVETTTTPPPQSTGSGAGTYSYYYLASADVTLPIVNGKVTAKVRRVFEKKITSPWNWAIYFQDDLEIHPNTSLTLDGWVHTNGNLYTASDKLTLTDRMTYVGEWNVGYAPSDVLHNNVLNPPSSPVTPVDLPPGKDQNWVPFGWYLNGIFDTADGNTNNDGYRELIEKPDAGSDALAEKRYYNQASVRIEIDGTNSVTIRNAAGEICDNTSASGTTKRLLYDTFKDGQAIRTNRSFQDNREQAVVRVVDVDIARVRQSFSSLGSEAFIGVIHISDTSASQTGGTPKRAIRIINGQSLPTGGLTIASDNPVYIKGNFNTGGDSPLSNSGDVTKPTVNGYERQPAAIIGDAITVLSKDFSDSNAGGNLSNRPAANTTVNAAILAGNLPSENGSYSGGAENFVRFLEDWTAKTFTYYGSMVQLYRSKQGIGTWGKGNVYLPATLKWQFDEKLLEASPPGKLVTVSYLQQQRWYLTY
jgi:hypothetical protein